jgi:hypothetical protein
MFFQKNEYSNPITLMNIPPPSLSPIIPSTFDIKMDCYENIVKISQTIDVNQLTFILNNIEKNKDKKFVDIDKSNNNNIPKNVIDKINSYYEYSFVF